MSGATLRPATAADLEAVRAVVFAGLAEHEYEPEPEGSDADLFEPERYFAGGVFDVAVDDGTGAVLGVVGVAPGEGRAAELRKLYVARDERGTGVACRLLARALAGARSAGRDALEIHTSSRMRRAIAFYLRHGFERHDPDCPREHCDVHLSAERGGWRACPRCPGDPAGGA